ncbi:hypothetical protein SAMN05428950_10139 [Sphingomonas sp. OV641]|uniref:hypothetical protein n=1 Tax=Sphingomonas sp. OV641 TaxID=1881068 RepID=UPI0008D852D9|nr:hypothetical protein [Sphingomonas sp. OV641]SEI72870.1 hypothetical protein SAMN05428950_10139 [Sphingomonas sp. OV641]
MRVEDVDRLVSDAGLALVNAQHYAATVAAVTPRQYAARQLAATREVQGNFVAKLQGRFGAVLPFMHLLDGGRRQALARVAGMLNHSRQLLATRPGRTDTLPGIGPARPPKGKANAELPSQMSGQSDGELRPGARRRAGLAPSRERIRVDRLRTSRAQMRSRAAQSKREHRRALLVRYRRVAPSAFRKGVETTLVRRGYPLRLVALVISVAASDFVQTMGKLLGDADGSSPLTDTVVNAAIASALAVAANRAGIIDPPAIEAAAKLISQFLSATSAMREQESEPRRLDENTGQQSLRWGLAS